MLTHDNMVPKTNRIEDFPDHWKATLLGNAFWKDAEDWNKETNNKIIKQYKFYVLIYFLQSAFFLYIVLHQIWYQSQVFSVGSASWNLGND